MASERVVKNEGITMSGNAAINSHVIVTGRNAQANVAEQSQATAKSASQLLDELAVQIKSLPQSVGAERETIERLRQVLVEEAAKPEPNRSLWKITSEGLKEAASAVATVAPGLLQTAKAITRAFA